MQETFARLLARLTVTPLIVVLVHGGPVDVAWLQESPRMDAILTAWYPGEMVRARGAVARAPGHCGATAGLLAACGACLRSGHVTRRRPRCAAVFGGPKRGADEYKPLAFCAAQHKASQRAAHLVAEGAAAERAGRPGDCGRAGGQGVALGAPAGDVLLRQLHAHGALPPCLITCGVVCRAARRSPCCAVRRCAPAITQAGILLWGFSWVSPALRVHGHE